jgi:hypothetical protein
VSPLGRPLTQLGLYQEIGFDYLVLCPGSTYGKPFKESSAILSNRYAVGSSTLWPLGLT